MSTNLRPPKVLWEHSTNPVYPETHRCFLEATGLLVAVVTDKIGTWSAELLNLSGVWTPTVPRHYRTLEQAKAAVMGAIHE